MLNPKKNIQVPGLDLGSIGDIEGARSVIIMLLSMVEELWRENEALRTETRQLWNEVTDHSDIPHSSADEAELTPLSELDEELEVDIPESIKTAEYMLLLREVRRRAREAETLRLAGAAVAATLRQKEAITRILTQLRRVVSHDSASVQLLRDDRLEIVGGHGWEQPEDEVMGITFPVPGKNPNTIVIEERRPCILRDAQATHKAFRKSPHNHIQSWLGVPLIVHDEVIGMLAVDSREVGHFNAEHARLVTAFADQVAIAVENAKLFEAERRRAEQIDALREIGVELTAELDLDSLLRSIVEHAIALLDAPAGGFYRYRPARDDLVWTVAVGRHLEPIGRKLIRGEGLSGKIMDTGHALIVNNYDEWEGRSRRFRSLYWTSLIGVPVQWGDELLGVLNVLDRSRRKFTEDDAEKLRLLATQAAIAIINARLFEAEQTAREVAETLRNVNMALTRSLDMDTVLEMLLTYLHELISFDGANVALLQENSPLASIEAVYGYDRWTDTAVAQNIVFDVRAHQHLEQLVSSGRSVLVRDVGDDVGWIRHLPGTEHVRSWLGVPLIAAGDVIGFFNLDKADANYFTNEHRRLAEAIAGQAAVAIQNARLFSAVKRMATRDELTGLYNRRYFFETAEQELRAARDSERLCGIIIFDVDRFKRINDMYGHRIGDEVLRAVAQRLLRSTRDTDIIGRYGGEEFVVFQSGGTSESLRETAERIRRRVDKHPIATTRGLVHITMSAGVAVATEKTRDLLNLFDRADTALYRAKEAGRNQVGYVPETDVSSPQVSQQNHGRYSRDEDTSAQ